MEKNDLTPEESFKIINKAIINLKMNYKEGAKNFLLWGWILTLASISNYVILKILHSRDAFDKMGFYSLANWSVFLLAGFIIHFFVFRKIKRGKKVYTYLDSYITHLWQVAIIAFFAGTFICFKLGIAPPPVMLLIAGLATTTSGLLIKFRPVIIGGLIFFVFSIATTFVSNENIALLVGIAIFTGHVIPGYYLKSAKE